MFERFAANQGLHLLQSITLEFSDGRYSDCKSDEVNNVIMDIQNEEDSSDLDDKYINQKAPSKTDDGVRGRSISDND